MRREIETSPNVLGNECYEFGTSVSEILGGSISPQRIKCLIDASNNQGFIFHGIKNDSKLPEIEDLGILPLTPEGGFISFWTMGESLFGTKMSGGGISTFDSTFFHYAPSRSRIEENSLAMNIAVAKVGLIDQSRPKQVNTQLTFNYPISRNLFALLSVQEKIKNNQATEDTMQELLRKMFCLIEQATVKDFQAGTTLEAMK